MPPASDQEFLRHADSALEKLLATFDSFDPDELEADGSAGVIRITFADGRNCILNRQSAAHQLWLAEGATAWHFTRDPTTGDWLDTKGRGTLHAILAEVISRRLGRQVHL